MSEGRKDDGGKLRMDLLSPEAIRGIAEVLTYGAAKYDDRNWEAGIKWGRVFAALLRHLWRWWGGEERDEESGLHHLDHSACCLHFLQTYRHTRPEFDDRPNKLASKTKTKDRLVPLNWRGEVTYDDGVVRVYQGRDLIDPDEWRLIEGRDISND